jgi:hypothetical protein
MTLKISNLKDRYYKVKGGILTEEIEVQAIRKAENQTR